MGNPKKIAALGLLLASFAILYRDVFAKLLHDWATDDNYSHGFLIIPIALYLAWERRHRLAGAVVQPRAFGLLVIMGSLAVLVAGVLGAELFLTRVSIPLIMAGTILFVGGWDPLRVLAFPVAFLFLMIPIPAIVFNEIALPLQLLASRFGEATLSSLAIPVLREGNVIHLSNTSLEVAEACSGIRSLVSLLTLGILYGYFTDPRGGIRVTIALAAIPIAILANGLRVAGTGVMAHYFGEQVAQGFFHTFTGWLLFVVAFAMLFGWQRLVVWVAPAIGTRPPALTPAAQESA